MRSRNLLGALLLALTPTTAFADVGLSPAPADSGCLGKVDQLEKWASTTPQDVISCLAQDTTFATGMTFLCSADQTDYSASFKKYLDFQDRFNSARADFQAAQDPNDSQRLQSELHDIQNDWHVFGYYSEGMVALGQIEAAKFHCTPR
jgi:hypothetical protein